LIGILCLLSEAHTKIAYSPLITFNVESFKLTLEKLNNYDIEFDGEPIDDELGKVKYLTKS
jgi:hypothetical protein